MEDSDILTITAQSAAVTGYAYRQERDTICKFVSGGMAVAGGVSYLAGRGTAISASKAAEILNPNTPPVVLKGIDEFSSIAVASSLFFGYFMGEITVQIKKFDEYRKQNHRK